MSRLTRLYVAVTSELNCCGCIVTICALSVVPVAALGTAVVTL